MTLQVKPYGNDWRGSAVCMTIVKFYGNLDLVLEVAVATASVDGLEWHLVA